MPKDWSERGDRRAAGHCSLVSLDLFGSPKRSISEEAMDAIEQLSSNSTAEARGAIFTRKEIVEFILDLVGYDLSKSLHKRRILEPSFGAGDFLLPIVDRLITSWVSDSCDSSNALSDLRHAICGVELHKDTFVRTREEILRRLSDLGIETHVGVELVENWLIQGDYLLEDIGDDFDFVVGNPPYLRQESIPAALLTEYRRRFSTMFDRADLYIPFFERSISLLVAGGTLGFICSDRWMKNRYGGPLRALISDRFHLKAHIDMFDSKPFTQEVSAYPAITIISNSDPGPTRIVSQPGVDKDMLSRVSSELASSTLPVDSSIREIDSVTNGSEPWLIDNRDTLALIRRLEREFPSLEQAGCKVGIGVATGADKVFIADFDRLDVEPDRKLPLVATSDIKSGEVVWKGKGVINPFSDEGTLVDLGDYPKLSAYLKSHRSVLSKRHCARKSPDGWYRTIDRIWPALTHKPKLLIPDIKNRAHIVFESGKLYPHHNLYHVTSSAWDLRALQAILLSDICRLVVRMYSVKVRGGYLRFQAQYLRRMRVPLWDNIPPSIRSELALAAESRDREACNHVVDRLYGLSGEEMAVLREFGD